MRSHVPLASRCVRMLLLPQRATRTRLCVQCTAVYRRFRGIANRGTSDKYVLQAAFSGPT
jgi:hypothetical protein